VGPMDGPDDVNDLDPATVHTDSPPTTLYRFFDSGGTLLYVGITSCGAARWSEHSRVQTWWEEVATATVEHYATRHLAAEAERAAIRAEHPKHNVVRYIRSPLRLTDEDLEWSADEIARDRAMWSEFAADVREMYGPGRPGRAQRHQHDPDLHAPDR
jgi:hypothetical protein